MTQAEIEECLNNISTKAEEVRIAASHLVDRIKCFETFLSKLPGRCETELISGELTLAFRRDGKVWKLLFKKPELPAGELIGASLKVKLEAVRLFPDLLYAMHLSQEQLILEIQAVCREHDAYVKELKGA